LSGHGGMEWRLVRSTRGDSIPYQFHPATKLKIAPFSGNTAGSRRPSPSLAFRMRLINI
jgi:hypothetical protein